MVASKPMTLTVWSFARAASTPTGTCRVRSDYGAITCASGGAFVDARDALMHGGSDHATRFPCRIIGRDDQGDLRCAPGKPTIDYDATEVLRSFARKCALDVVHLWKVTPVVKRYLRTGNPKLRDAAGVAARGAAWNATRVAAWDTAWAAAEATAAATAWDAAETAARAVAWDVAWATARARQSRRLARMLQAGARGSR